MTNLKDQIEENIRKGRERSEKLRQNGDEHADKTGKRFDDIRPELDELSHTTDKYSLTVRYAKGPYSAVIAVLELNKIDGTWVAAWHVGTTVGEPVHDWEVAYNPHGVEIQREWFANSGDLFKYLTASVAERIIEMEADEG